jgi:hypothetical protein
VFQKFLVLEMTSGYGKCPKYAPYLVQFWPAEILPEIPKISNHFWVSNGMIFGCELAEFPEWFLFTEGVSEIHHFQMPFSCRIAHVFW